MSTFNKLWNISLRQKATTEKEIAHRFFEHGQNTPKKDICDTMLMGIEQDRLRKEQMNKHGS